MKPLKPSQVLKFERNCYILMQGNWIHPHAPIMRVEMLWYPERAMPAFEQYLYRPYVQSVVTENPWVISLYDRERVSIPMFIWACWPKHVDKPAAPDTRNNIFLNPDLNPDLNRN